MKVTWWVEDGSASSVHHTVEVNEEDLEGLTLREREDVILQYVQDAFNERVSFGFRCEP